MSRALAKLAIVLGLALVTGAIGCRAPALVRMSRLTLEDQIRGGWAGQMIGVSYGAASEFQALGKTFDGPLPWSPEMVSNAIDQDDLYVEVTFIEVLDRDGIDAPSERFGEAFRDSKYELWHANAGARRLLSLGLKPPETGRPERNIHAGDIDFQIEADFIGLMAPGLPRASNRLCDRVGRVMNSGDGLHGGMFIAGMYGAAFFEKDLRRVVEAGLACIPAESGYAAVIRDVLDLHAADPRDWRRCWQRIEERWDRDDPCSDGALDPFNIDARLNGAFVAIGLLYGGGDFAKTLEIATRSGQDSDCNPASAGGILGVILGWSGLPERFKAGIPAIARTKFSYTSYSFEDAVRSSLARAVKLIEAEGGRAEGLDVLIPVQSPIAPPLEAWDPGAPERIIPASNPGWAWKGTWKTEQKLQVAEGAGPEATLTFTGTGVAVVGRMSGDGGRADVFVDGQRSSIVLEAWIPPSTNDNDLWHLFGLAPGEHTLRIVPRDDAEPRSSGKKVAIEKAIVYRAR